MLKMTAAALMASALALPVYAQTTSNTGHAAPMGTPAPATSTHSPAAAPAASSAATTTPAANPMLTENGNLRASKVIGSSVYNEQDQSIGSIDDIVIGQDHTMKAIIQVGGFLGMGGKMVEVPFNKLQFGNSGFNNGSADSTSTATTDMKSTTTTATSDTKSPATTSTADTTKTPATTTTAANNPPPSTVASNKAANNNHIVLPGMTKDALTNMPEYHYTKQG